MTLALSSLRQGKINAWLYACITDQIKKFEEDYRSGRGDIIPGICYQSKYLAIGYFSPNDSSELRFIGCDKIVLEIPEGALPGTDPQLVYMYLEMFEDNISTMSPRVNCGPDGLRFQVCYNTISQFGICKLDFGGDEVRA